MAQKTLWCVICISEALFICTRCHSEIFTGQIKACHFPSFLQINCTGHYLFLLITWSHLLTFYNKFD